MIAVRSFGESTRRTSRPSAKASPIPSANDVSANSSVAGKRSSTSSIAGRASRMELPKSPWSAFCRKRPYWIAKRLVEAQSLS